MPTRLFNLKLCCLFSLVLNVSLVILILQYRFTSTQYTYLLSTTISTYTNNNFSSSQTLLQASSHIPLTLQSTTHSQPSHKRSHTHKNKSKFNVWLVSTIGFNSSYAFIPYFIEWYKNIGILPQHFLLNIHINFATDNHTEFNQLLQYLNTSNITNYSLWESPIFTSTLKKERERQLISSTISRYDYIIITDVDELQDWNNYGVYNIYDFIRNEMLPYQYEYVTGYLIDRFAHNASLIDPQTINTHNFTDGINVTHSLFEQYPHACDFTQKIVDGIIDKVCLYLNIYEIAGGGRHRVEKRLKKYKHKSVRIMNKDRFTNKIRGDSIMRYKPWRIKIQHFKWKKDVVFYLKERTNVYREQGIPWWEQSQKAVDWLEDNAGSVNLDTVSEFNCKYDPTPALLKKESMDILLCSDENDKIPLYALINSIIRNEKKFKHRLNFHILVLNDTQMYEREMTQYFAKFLDKINFEIAAVTESEECMTYIKLATKYMRGNNEFRLNDAMNFARFCLPLVFKNVSRGVYLDADMVVRTSISTIFETYDSNSYIGWSVLNRNASKIIMREDLGNEAKMNFINNYLIQNLSVNPIDFANIPSFFNGGILFFDLNVWRERGWIEQSLELYKFDKIYKREFGVRPWVGVTQPIYNLLFVINGFRVGDFGLKWNVAIKDLVKGGGCDQKQIGTEGIYILKRAYVLHWAGACKPWINGTISTANLWNKYVPQNVYQKETYDIYAQEY